MFLFCNSYGCTLRNNANWSLWQFHNIEITMEFSNLNPLSCGTTYQDVANSVSKFGGILFAPIQ